MPIDLAPFGRIIYYYGDDPRKRRFVDAQTQGGAYVPSEPDSGGRRHLCLQWAEPRDIYSIALTFVPGTMPDPQQVEVQWWHLRWPFAFRDNLRGARRGWAGRDDHYHGEWITTISNVTAEGDRAVFDFCHLDLTELPDTGVLEHAEDFNAEFRCALQFRLMLPVESDARVTRVEAFTKGNWAEGEVDVFGVDDASVDAWNGWITSVERRDDALNIRYLYIPSPPDDLPHRRTVITIRDPEHPFSFSASDVSDTPCRNHAPPRSLYVEDFSILVRQAGDGRTPEAIVDELVASGRPCIYDRVLDEPEQTFERAMNEIPQLRAPFQHHPFGRYCPLGCEGSRQHFALRYNGSLLVEKWANKSAGRDTVNLLWNGMSMQYRFASGDFPNFREYENACRQSWDPDGAPVITSVWVDRDIEYTQTAFAAYLREDMGEFFSKRGDEDIALFIRFEIRNIAHDNRRAHLWLQTLAYEHVDYASSVLSAQGRLVRTEVMASDELAAWANRPDVPETFNWEVKPYERPLGRCRIDLGKGIGLAQPLALDKTGPAGVATAFHYQSDLDGGETDVVTFIIPYCTLREESELRTLASLDYGAKLEEVRRFWTGYADSGMQISIPDKMIEDFYSVVPVHIAMSVQKDPGTGKYIVPAATWGYGVCGNEAVIQIRQLDYRGHHKQAEQYLDGLILMQGAIDLNGNFRSREGALPGVAFYNGKPLGGTYYNTDHGYILWALSEHYFMTRDKEWLRRVAPNIMAGCDFVIRERQATKVERSGERVPDYGLLPAGQLEDNEEWRYWFAVNSHAYLGIKWAAEALAEIDHPDASNLADEAGSYKSDILTAIERAQVESPVVTLPDNTSIPHVPTRTDIRGPEWGWFREGAYGPLHMVDAHVLEPNDERVTWTMKYLEDLVYPTRDLGRPIDIEKLWFSQAGITIQANLLNNGVAYVRRDEPEHAVRALFNDFAASIYRDVLVFTEHPVVQLSRGVGPYYKTPDECGFLNLLRACMVIEEGNTLYLAKAAPASWFRAGETVELRDGATWFGPVSYRVEVNDDSIEAHVRPPRRNPPSKLALRLRRADGKPVKSVTVNGGPGDWDPESKIVWLDPLASNIRLVARL